MYWPPLFSAGVIVAVFTALVLAALLIWYWRQARRLKASSH